MAVQMGKLKAQMRGDTLLARKLVNHIISLFLTKPMCQRKQLADNAWFNQGRMSTQYVYSNLTRLKEVYSQYR